MIVTAVYYSMTLQAQVFLYGLLACILHESAHIIVATYLGVRVKKVGVTWKGIYIIRESGNPLQNLAITLAGPFTNLLSVGVVGLERYLGEGAFVFAFLSLLIGIFNLLPIPGSDGKRALGLLQTIVPASD